MLKLNGYLHTMQITTYAAHQKSAIHNLGIQSLLLFLKQEKAKERRHQTTTTPKSATTICNKRKRLCVQSSSSNFISYGHLRPRFFPSFLIAQIQSIPSDTAYVRVVFFVEEFRVTRRFREFGKHLFPHTPKPRVCFVDFCVFLPPRFRGSPIRRCSRDGDIMLDLFFDGKWLSGRRV